MKLTDAMWSGKPFKRIGTHAWLVYINRHVYNSVTEELVSFNAEDVMAMDYITLDYAQLITYTDLKNAWKEVFGSLVAISDSTKEFIKEQEKLEELALKLKIKRRGF